MKTAKPSHEGIQKALNLKRHERPPSNFFDQFPDRVIDRITTRPLPGPQAWYERLGFGENWKLGLLCLSGAVLCVALATGLIAARKVPPPDEPPGNPQEDPAAAIYATPPDSSNIIGPGLQPVPGVEDTPDSAKPVMVPTAGSGSPAPSPLVGPEQ